MNFIHEEIRCWGGVESVGAVGVTEQRGVYDLIPAPPPFCGCVLASLRLELV